MKKTSDLKILPVNKTVVFTSPLEGDDVLVRTGIIKDGSCFFHAILHAYSKDYTSMNKSERMKFVRKIRASMVGKVDKESWEEMAGGVIAKVPFLEMVHKILSNFDLFLSGTNEKIRGRATRKTVKLLVKDESELEVYKVIYDLLPVQILLSEVLPAIYKKCNDLKVSDTINLIVEEASSYFYNLKELKSVDKKKKEYLFNVFKIYIKIVCNEAYKETYKNYNKGLENTKEDIDYYSIQFISERFDRDLYFIDSNDRIPYEECPDECPDERHISGKKSIILIKLGQHHYEILGKLLPGNKIQREFDFEDPLVKKINMFLHEPRKLKYNYPELQGFLPKSPRRKSVNKEDNNVDDGEDMSDDESDLYYDSSGISGSDTDEDDDE